VMVPTGSQAAGGGAQVAPGGQYGAVYVTMRVSGVPWTLSIHGD
jgi:hypothetical protein